MSSKYKNINRITKPMSMFRYPTKKWKFSDDFTKDFDSLCPLRMLNQSIVTQTFQFGETTVDFRFYKGDEKNFETYIERVIWELRFDDNSEFERFLNVQTKESSHYTVICHSCEKWGNIKTKKYVEIFPTEWFKMCRSDRPTLFGYFDEGGFVFLNGEYIPQSEREPNTDTPTMFLLGESHRTKKVEKVNLQKLSFDELMKEFIRRERLGELRN